MSAISTHALAKHVVDQLEIGTPAKEVSRKLAAYLLDERRSRDAAAVLRAVEAELERRGSTQVTVTSAHEISDATKKQLAEMLKAKNPVFEEVIDPNVIGGVKAVAGENQVDLTVRARLNRFKQHVISNSK